MRTDPDRPTSWHVRAARRLLAPALIIGLVAAAGAQILPAAAGIAPAALDATTLISLQRDGNTRVSNLRIQSTWATQCPPSFQTASISGNDLRIDARTMLNLCPREPTRYAIELNPALALGIDALAPGVYHVSYYAANGAQADPKLLAFTLVDTHDASAAAIVPETGFWWTTANPGQGTGRNVFSLELQGTQLTAALMSYDHDGRGNWQFGAGNLSGRTAHIPLLQLTGGSDPFSAASTIPRGENGVVLDLEFHSNAQATAWLSRASGDDNALQLQALELVRLPFADAADGSAWKGDWILVADAQDSAPQRLHFVAPATVSDDRFVLVDTGSGIAIECLIDPASPELPPRSCALHTHDGTALGDFPAVAITRMDGVRNDGAALHLLRITP